MRAVLIVAFTTLMASGAMAQEYGRYSANPYTPNRVNPYQSGGSLYTDDGDYRGRANNNRFDPDSTSNPYGRYGSRYSSDSINNPYGAGSRFRSDSPNNRFGSGLKVCGSRGCD